MRRFDKTHGSEKTSPDFIQPIYTLGLSKWEVSTPPRASVEEIKSYNQWDGKEPSSSSITEANDNNVQNSLSKAYTIILFAN